jgi:hypothetical protein
VCERERERKRSLNKVVCGVDTVDGLEVERVEREREWECVVRLRLSLESIGGC